VLKVAKVVLCIVVLPLCLVGCIGPSVHIPVEASHLPLCAHATDPYPVADIGKHQHAPCDLSGTQIIFPDGFVMFAPEIGAGGSASGNGHDDTHTLFNFGKFGLIAGETVPHAKHTNWWGTTEGLHRYWAAFGKLDSELYG
jgi:hypothetical protein